MRIRKVKVAAGIFWIEIPEAGLRVLCGCPADSVKHLIKRGLIVSQEVGGVVCETGPNAILLSDIALQNGEFANMAEFPVLQMLYKQGMIIPGHPNNTGAKPMLIGMAEQVGSQMRYIYRGNYGLVSKEEIMQAGIPEDRAAEMMRLKLKFAFGHIRPSDDFLDPRPLGDGQVEICRGVSVRRMGVNLFEFAFEGERVGVDLNLAPGERYSAPYHLGFRRFEPEYFGVIHSGEGDGWDTDRPSMSSILTFQGRVFLIDAGPNLSSSLAALGIGIEQVDGIFHTHAHDDHFAGLTTLMRSGKRIGYFATPLVRASVAKKLAALLDTEEERFNDFFDVRDLEFDVWNDIEGLEVKPIFSPHPLETSIFIFRALWGDGWKSYAHFADIVSMDVLKGMVTDDAKAPGLSMEAFERVRRDYLTPADVKKIDIGGGMIHGAAKDFRTDSSGRILLAHRVGEPTPEEKEIGSCASFGTSDVLIPGRFTGLRRFAFDYLELHLPGAPLHHLRTLLNIQACEINPGAIFLREGEVPTHVILVISGLVEKIRTRDDFLVTLSAGSIIGEMSGVDGLPSKHTYRAASFVRAVNMPVGLYREMVRRNGLEERMRRTADLRSFLESSFLFGEGVPASVLGRIIDGASERIYRVGENITCGDLGMLNVIRSGRAERLVGGEVLDVLGKRDFFGEEGAIFGMPCLFRLSIVEEVTAVRIPGQLLHDVPIVRWKLLQSYQRRAASVIHSGNEINSFIWRDEFSVRVADMDTHHKKLVEIANAVIEAIRNDNRTSREKSFAALIEYARYHFEAEEELIGLYGYPGLAGHKSRHAELIRQVEEYSGLINEGLPGGVSEFRRFFESWLIRHILGEDRKYAEFLNSKGIY